MDLIRQYSSGATKSSRNNKPQYEGYLNPLVIKEFGKYMFKHQKQADGNDRPADNWQQGIPKEDLLDSCWRHFEDVWLHHRGYAEEAHEPLLDALCAVMFNIQAYMLSVLLEEKNKKDGRDKLFE